MRVELAQEEREGGGEQLLPLLVESRAGKGIGVIVKKLEKFVCGSAAFHGNEEADKVFEVKLPFSRKVDARIFGEAPRVFRHLGNVAPKVSLRPFGNGHRDILLVIEVGIRIQLQGPLLLTVPRG